MIYTGEIVVRHAYDDLLMERIRKLFANVQKDSASVRKLYDDDMGMHHLTFTLGEHTGNVLQSLINLYEAARELGVASSMTLYRSELVPITP